MEKSSGVGIEGNYENGEVEEMLGKEKEEKTTD
jgi:hypothetical protein